MIKKSILFLFLNTLILNVFAQIVPYRIFDKEGKEVGFEQMADATASAEVVFFGELHNNSLAHWLQLQLMKHMQKGGKEMVLAGEFFERDDQLNIDEWFAGKMTDKTFEAEAKLWNNYLRDYKPLLVLAKENNIPFVASNVPRKYASLVSKEGLEALHALSDEGKRYIAPLPIEVDKTLKGYAGMKDMMHGSGMNLDFMIEAQAVKDATMAFSLFDFLGKGKSILHINGSYHSNNYEGILWYLNKAYPNTKTMTINTVEQENTDSLDEENKMAADYTIVLTTDSPKSY
ncbi:ChaN family lipoprotein [Rhodonellum sp.]|uniref:ChaN family lipoprotein n=1 Tax=Rhodonellum sp. TaxID=2231180 RepID=UPI00272D2A0F|nr:ChaN family lipoprotein [Rhodonellum sp.]